MPLARFEPVTPATKRPLTYALDLAATEIDCVTIHSQALIVQDGPLASLFGVS
jgi:hypothetical protein